MFGYFEGTTPSQMVYTCQNGEYWKLLIEEKFFSFGSPLLFLGSGGF